VRQRHTLLAGAVQVRTRGYVQGTREVGEKTINLKVLNNFVINYILDKHVQ
jgi:hypothetical protein